MLTKNFAPKVWKRPHTSTYNINWKYGKGLYEPVVESLSVTNRASSYAPSVSNSSADSYTGPPSRVYLNSRQYDTLPARMPKKSRSILDFQNVILKHGEEEDNSFGLQRSKSMANFSMNNDEKYRRSKLEMNRMKRQRERDGTLLAPKWY